MKTAIFFTTVLIFECLSCTQELKTLDKEMVLVIDVTDPLTVKPDEQDIYAYLGLKADIWQAVQVTVTSISETDINPEKVFSLPRGTQWLGNTAVREAQVARFRKQIRDYLITLEQQAKCSMGHSIVYRTLAKELTQITQQPAKSKCLLIYSDLMNNDSISFYDPATYALLKTCPSSIRCRLEKSYPLPKLENISIYCLYTPKSYEANSHYMVVAGFYKAFFESKGAIVYLKNSIN